MTRDLVFEFIRICRNRKIANWKDTQWPLGYYDLQAESKIIKQYLELKYQFRCNVMPRVTNSQMNRLDEPILASNPNHIIAISKKNILCGHLVNCCVIIFSISICSLSLSAGCFPRRKRIWWKKPFPWNALQPMYTTYCPIKVYITYHFGYFPIWQFNALIQRLLHIVLKL